MVEDSGLVGLGLGGLVLRVWGLDPKPEMRFRIWQVSVGAWCVTLNPKA